MTTTAVLSFALGLLVLAVIAAFAIRGGLAALTGAIPL